MEGNLCIFLEVVHDDIGDNRRNWGAHWETRFLFEEDALVVECGVGGTCSDCI